MKQLKHLVMLGQLGLSVAVPPVLCILASQWLMQRFALGKWIMLLGVLLGLGGAASGLCSTLRQLKAAADREDPPSPTSFNEHE